MNTFDLILASLACVAGIMVVSITTVACAAGIARRRRERQLFRDYLEHPHEVEEWLVRGAVEEVRERFALR
jgi:hypothetical protein